jgi:plastocyanin
MSAPSRRNVLRSFVTGGVLAAAAPSLAAQHGQLPVPGALSLVTVAFGQWNTPIDRFGPTGPPNVGHHLSPREVTLAVGGTVSFLIGGFHLVLVYDGGKLHTDVNVATATGTPPLINDTVNRIYRGLPPTAGVDRIENVHFHQPGRYLFVCGVLPHFNDGMYGYVNVVGR